LAAALWIVAREGLHTASSPATNSGLSANGLNPKNQKVMRVLAESIVVSDLNVSEWANSPGALSDL
jgi:hypothetical protein